MAVPTSFTDLSTTPGSNSPAGSENVFPNLDDYIRFINAALASIKANTATNGWVSPYLSSWTAPGTIGSVTPNTINGTTGSFTGMLGVSGSALFGYLAGAGGTVTQSTDKSTAVTLNKPCGQITMNNAALASGTRAVFTLNNSLVSTSDVVFASVAGGFSGYDIQTRVVSAGVANINVLNFSAGPLSDGITINFVVIKGATA